VKRAYEKLKVRHGLAKSKAVMAHKFAVAVYHMLKNGSAFDERKFLGGWKLETRRITGRAMFERFAQAARLIGEEFSPSALPGKKGYLESLPLEKLDHNWPPWKEEPYTPWMRLAGNESISDRAGEPPQGQRREFPEEGLISDMCLVQIEKIEAVVEWKTDWRESWEPAELEPLNLVEEPPTRRKGKAMSLDKGPLIWVMRRRAAL
jgi:hypothetical protein